MPEHVELQHLVDADVENTTTNYKRKFSILLCKSCPYMGLVLATFSSLFFSLCSVIVKSLVEVNPTEMAIFRFLGVLLPAIPIMIYKAIFARIFLKEPCGLFNIVTVCLTLIGVILVTRPPLIFGHTIESLSDGHVKPKDADLWSAMAAFSATLFGANAYVLLRALKGLHFSVIMTNFGSFALIQTTLISWAIGALCIPRCGTDRLLVVALALFSFAGQILLTIALQIEQAGPVAIARSTDIVFAFFWQVLFFNEIPNRYSVGGAILVTSSVLLTGLRKWALSLPETSNIKKSLGILVI